MNAPARDQAEIVAEGLQFHEGPVWLPDGTVLVQAAPDERETLFLFDIARQTPGVLGVIGWVDMEADDAARRIAALAEQGQGLLRGIRPMVQDIADTQWLARPSLDRAFDALHCLRVRTNGAHLLKFRDPPPRKTAPIGRRSLCCGIISNRHCRKPKLRSP